MTKAAKPPIHRGISDFALWVLVNERKPVILAGRRVIIHEAKPSMTKGEGYFIAKVSGEGSSSVYTMHITTSEYEHREQHRRETLKRHKQERQKRGL